MYGACIQEHWRVGVELLENPGMVAIFAGLVTRECHRGSQGVGIVLSKAAAVAWKASGSEKHVDLGARVCAVRLKVTDAFTRKTLWIFLISAYSPVGCAPQAEHDEYLRCLDVYIARKQPGDFLLIGTDANASLGRREAGDDAHGSLAVGPFGEPHVNDAGLRLRTYLDTRGLTAASTHFKKPNYATWKHPQSGRVHQIDHFLVESSKMKHVKDCGITESLVDSDHRALKCVLYVVARKKRPPVESVRRYRAALDFAVLRGDDASDVQNRELFNGDVMRAYDALSADMGVYPRLAAALGKACEKMPKRKRASPGWFEAAKAVLLPLIAARNAAMARFVSSRRTRGVYLPLCDARRKLHRAVLKAKNDWIMEYVGELNAASARGGSKASWAAVKVLKAGLTKTKPLVARAMKKANGEIAKSPEENAEVFAKHFQQLYGREPGGDPSVVDALPDHAIRWELGDAPTDVELASAVRELRNTAPGKSGLPAAVWKSLLQTEASRAVVLELVTDIWQNERQPTEFDVGVLAILPKKGDLSLPGNHRGIMMLEVAYKIMAIIASKRLYVIVGLVEHETQVGFRPGRGCSDGAFNLRMAVRKRREHGLETWVLYLDLVKAFDRVPRAMLWAVLAKFGVPAKLIAVLKALHASVLVEFEVDGVSRTISSITGVKQGDVLGPVLFVLYMAAVMMAWRSEHPDIDKCVFYSRDDAVLAGRPTRQGRANEAFSVPDSEYADDTALLFCCRPDLVRAVPLVYSHFALWGMEVHSGLVGQQPPAKTVAQFCAAHPATYTNPATFTSSDGVAADLSPVLYGDGREVQLVEKFKYLGSWNSTNGSDEADVIANIKSAGGAFGALGKAVFRATTVSMGAKRVVYNGLVLSILLFGSESWVLTEKLLRLLRGFHASCLRAMCRVTMWHVRHQRISTADLEERLGVQPLDVYLFRRQLAWAGHVARMDWKVRMPRKLLSAWCKHDAWGGGRRPACGQMMSYWSTLKKALRRADVGVADWYELAQDRAKWRAMIGKIK